MVGYNETTEVVASSPDTELPAWLLDLINTQKNEPVANPPALIARYEYKGQTVYFLPQRCCDIFSNLYDAEGNIIGHPDGGITGQGDGRVPDSFETRTDEIIVWSDQRAYDPELVQVTAPIESVEVLVTEVMVMESFPVQYNRVVVSLVPGSCRTFGGYYLDRKGASIHVEMVNWRLPGLYCADVLAVVETVIPLGSEFESGQTYTIVAGDVTETFLAQ
ncbi:MAG: hypothetical protein O2783_07310 [Chloroflexi bacterium]|nr:hypothetical protein [Chloroflexota bacterium]